MVSLTRRTQDRLLSITAVGLCILVVGVSATALESSLTTEITPDPPDQEPNSGLSLLALLYALLNAILGLFGISLKNGGGTMPGAPILQLVVSGLQVLYHYRLLLGAGIAVLTVLLLGFQHRNQLQFPTIRPTSSTSTQQPQPDPQEGWPASTPSNPVAQAWVEMTTSVDIDNPHARTPEEWRTAAIEAGFDPAAVHTITEAFRDVTYGNSTVTPVRRKRVQMARLELTTTDEGTGE